MIRDSRWQGEAPAQSIRNERTLIAQHGGCLCAWGKIRWLAGKPGVQAAIPLCLKPKAPELDDFSSNSGAFFCCKFLLAIPTGFGPAISALTGPHVSHYTTPPNNVV